MAKRLYMFEDTKRPNRVELIKKFQYEHTAGLHQINKRGLFTPSAHFLYNVIKILIRSQTAFSKIRIHALTTHDITYALTIKVRYFIV